MENMRMTKLRALTRWHQLRGYSKLRKAELIAFLQDNERRQTSQQPQQPQQQAQQPQQHPQQQQLQTKIQQKRRRAKDTKLTKCFVNLNSEINSVKLEMDELKEKISCTSRSAHSGFKRKKIRTMKREADKISVQLAESETHLGSMRVPKDPVGGAPLKLHPTSRPKCIEVKIAELNKKICRTKNG